MIRIPAKPETTQFRPSYAGAGMMAACIFVLYMLTLAPAAALWDSGEYMAATKVLGLPHPPGNPLFIIIAHVAGMIPLPVAYAVRINVLNAACSAFVAGMWFLVAEQVAGRRHSAPWERRIAGGAAALLGATAFTVWSQSVVNEKVYMVSLALIAIISWIALRWIREPGTPASDRLLVLTAYCLGLGYAIHPAGFLPIPALAVMIVVRRWSTLLRWRLVVACVGALALGVTPFAFESVRSAHFPRMNEGEPTKCTEHIGVSCTFSSVTARRLAANINREQYGEKLERGAPYPAQLAMWWLYYRWQWLRDLNNTMPALQGALSLVFLGLTIYGGVVHWRADRPTFWYIAPLIFTLTFALVYYLNFKYGASQSPELGDAVDREVRDRDYFFVWSFSTLSIWMGVGLIAAWRQLACALARVLHSTRSTFRWWSAEVLAGGVLALAIIPLAVNWRTASRRGETFTRDWATDVLNSVEPYGILITEGDNDTFPLWYAQEVEGIRQDVLVLVTSYLNIDWYLRQAVRNPVRPYDVARGPSFYRDMDHTPPASPPFHLTFEQIDALPDNIKFDTSQHFQHSTISTTIPAGVLTRDQIVTLYMIRDSSPRRPIYFMSARYPRTLGLGNYLERQGIVEKLIAWPDSSLVKIADEHMNVARTMMLWQSYRAPRALERQGRWIDFSSRIIPWRYIETGRYVAWLQAESGNQAGAIETSHQVERLAQAAGIPSGI